MNLKYKHPDMSHKIKGVKVTKKEVTRIIQEEVKNLLEHFKENGWQINKQWDTLHLKILGFDPLEILSGEMSKYGISTVVRSDGSYFELDEGYYPIYYDSEENKIILVEDSYDKSYISKYSSPRYEQIGWL